MIAETRPVVSNTHVERRRVKRNRGKRITLLVSKDTPELTYGATPSFAVSIAARRALGLGR